MCFNCLTKHQLLPYITCILQCNSLRDTLKAFNGFINKLIKNVWSNVLWFVKVYIFWKCIQYTIHWDKTQMLKKFPLDKINGKNKCPLFFFWKLQLIAVLLLICDFYLSWSARLASLKLMWDFPLSILFRFSFWFSVIFLFNKMHGLFDFKTSQFYSKSK